MRLISRIEIERFRSIKELDLKGLADFTALAGLNNSGKSNVLRALHAFFRDEAEPGLQIDIVRDFHRAELAQKKKKTIRVALTFALPTHFKFRAGLESAEELLGRSFRLTKEWRRDATAPLFFLNDKARALSLEDAAKVEQFLGMVSFRYIPNRVVPTDVIRTEQGALRDALVRRLGKRAPPEEVFDKLRSTSKSLIKGIAKHFRRIVPDVTELSLKTPQNWAEILFALGYQLASGEVQLDDSVQGSGIQSMLMFETLALIDRDYFQQFGWRQAAIWAVEEPESSLHASLEAQLAFHLAELASEEGGRLQIITTTHSDLVVQYAGGTVFLQRENGSTRGEVLGVTEALDQAARAGVSRWTHPLLYYPLEPLVLVEGPFDVDFLERAFRLLKPETRVRVLCVGQLEGQSGDSGIDRMRQYLKEHREAVRARRADARVLALLDWEMSKKNGEFERLFTPTDPFEVAAWPESALNSTLGPSFRGIERAFSDRLVAIAEENGAEIGVNRKGIKLVERDKYEYVKQRLNAAIKVELRLEDLSHCAFFLGELLQRVEPGPAASRQTMVSKKEAQAPPPPPTSAQELK